MGLWIISRLKLRTDQMMTHDPSSRDQFVLVRLDKREKYTIQAKKALLLMYSSCIAYLSHPVSSSIISKICIKKACHGKPTMLTIDTRWDSGRV